MAIQIPIIIATSGAKALVSVASALAKSVGVGARTAVRTMSRKIGKLLQKTGLDVLFRQFGLEFGLIRQISSGAHRSAVTFRELTGVGRILRVVDWAVPDVLLNALDLGIIDQDDREFLENLQPLVRAEMIDEMDRLQVNLEDQITREIFN